MGLLFLVACSRETVLGGPVALYRRAEPAPVSASNVVDSVAEGSPAASAGLQAGDRVVSVAGVPTNDWPAIVGAVRAWGATHHDGDPLEVACERDGVRRTVTVTPRWIDLPDGQRAPMIGLVAGPASGPGGKPP